MKLCLFAVSLVTLGACTDSSERDVDVSVPATLALGFGDCGATASSTFVLGNAGTDAATVQLAATDPAFTITPAAATIDGGGSASFTLTWAVPASARAGVQVDAMIEVTGDADATMAVTGVPRGAQLAVEPSPIDFGAVNMGGRSVLDFRVVNTGNANATVAIAQPGGDFTLPFEPVVVSAGSDWPGLAHFSPSTVGNATASAAITVDGVVCGAVPSSLPLSGQGQPEL